MRTRVVSISSDTPELMTLRLAGGALRSGALVAFPTETVYGLGANALDQAAVRAVFTAKGRPWNDPLIVHLADTAQLSSLVAEIPDEVARLRRFWPGPLTVVLKRSDAVPDEVSAGLPTVAIRFPAHPVARGIIQAAGVPVAAPSANRFSRPSPTTAQDVLEDLDGRIDLVLDGGATPYGVESTVVDLTGPIPRLLRPGAVPLEALRPHLPEILSPAQPLTPGSTPAASPGMLTRHYSPRARLELFVGGTARTRFLALKQAVQAWTTAGKRVGVMLPTEQLAELEGIDVVRATLGAAGCLEEAAQRLFGAMRALDRARVDVIATLGYDLEGLGRTLQDRLLRASEGRVIQVASDPAPST